MSPRKDNRNGTPSAPGESFKASKNVSTTDLPSPLQSLSPPSVYLPDKKEREGYYYGLPSEPPLIARSSSERWVLPPGPYNRPEPKVLKNIGNHPLASLLAIIKGEIVKIFDSHSILWTTIAAFRIGSKGQKDIPVVLWIGALAKGLIGRDGASLPVAGIIVMACKQLLEKNQILDVHCELKLSEAYRVTNPALVKPSASWTRTVDVEVDLTPTIGTCLAQADLLSEGTFGFYVKFPEHGNNVFAVTCRHVLFPVSANKLYHHKISSQPRRLVSRDGSNPIGTISYIPRLTSH